MLESAELELFAGTREERLPGLSPAFPYLSSLARPDLFPVPWHWHRCVEVFYMERGGLEYVTPGGRLAFPPGSGGFINANVLHRTQPLPERGECVQLLHIFDPALLSGSQGGLIEERYIPPYRLRRGADPPVPGAAGGKGPSVRDQGRLLPLPGGVRA